MVTLKVSTFLGVVLLLLVSGGANAASVASYSVKNNPNRRETPVSGGGSASSQPQIPVYSTLPQNVGGAGQPNYFDYQVDQIPQAQQPQPQFVAFQPQPQIQVQPQEQQQFQQFPQQSGQFAPVGTFGGDNGGGFEGFNGDFNGFEQQGENEIQEESPGFFTSLMNTILEGTRFSGLFARVREMWSGLSDQLGGGFMSRVAMGAMALPIMLPMAAVPIGLGALGLMAFPILQLTLPGIRRSISTGGSLLVSEECMERLSCNLAKRFEYDALFSRLERSDNRWLNRVSKSVKAARTGEDCKQFVCSPVTKMQNMVRTYLLGDAENKKVQESNEDKKVD